VDTNGTRFHLLQGEADWSRCRTAGGVPAFDESMRQVQWHAPRNEVTLWQEAFRFPGAEGERPVAIDNRRGAARDRFGNWYWIAPDRESVLVFSSGWRNTSVFWPPEPFETDAGTVAEGRFRPVTIAPPEPVPLQGLAVTEDRYLVVGTVEPAGLLIFDLYAGGPPRQRLWTVDFEPFDLAPRAGGGVWILARDPGRVWELDRRFELVAPESSLLLSSDPWFVNTDGMDDPEPDGCIPRVPLSLEHGWEVPAGEVVAIDALPGGGVLVLERDDGSGFARVHWLEGGHAHGAPASTQSITRHIRLERREAPFTLVGHDFAVAARAVDDPDDWVARLYVVGTEGNQAFAFGVKRDDEQLALVPVPGYFPMRLFGGRALVAAGGEPWYDCGDRWVRLMEQKRPRYAEEGELWTPVLDSGEPGCVWHRLMLDACIPPGAGLDVYTRASDDWRELTLLEWLTPPERRALGASDPAAAPDAFGAGAPAAAEDLAEWRQEPSPYLRHTGPELPYLPREAGVGRGTWELLFQRARGRYLQVRLVLHGDGRSTPRLRALRAWFPRFSYLERYLPAVYREDSESASFLERFLANFEGVFTAIEDRIAAVQMLLDVESAPPEALDWLGRWFGVALDPTWEDDRRRLFLRHAMEFFAARGTVRGLQMALRLTLDECVDERLFTQPARAARNAAPVRIIERFRARRTPRALLGEVSTAVPGPQWLDPAARWEPSLGGAELHRRYREALELADGTTFPLVGTGAPAGWEEFAERTLGFAPQVGADERASWQGFLQKRYESIEELNEVHGSAWSAFDDVLLPDDQPALGALADDWRAFLAGTHGHRRGLWQSFLARRYRSVSTLNARWNTNWADFASVALPDRLPADGPPLVDWFQFEGVVLAMHRRAHRFTVMLPVPRQIRTDTPAQQRRLALARLVLDLEKPAHTVYDMRFYWAMFRLGEARLGDDTLIDLGSRSPQLMAPMVLGEGYLGEAFPAAPPGRDAPERLQIGRDRIGRSTRLGGP
jgi:phage tail-like protein